MAGSGWAQADDLDALHRRVAELYQRGKYSDAAKIAERVLALEEKKSGSNNPDIGAPLNNLAVLYAQLGRYAEAETLYKRGLAIAEKALGKKHPDVGSALNNLAVLYDQLGRYEEAEPLYKRSLAIVEEATSKNHLSVGIGLNNLATLYRSQGRYKESELLQKRSLAIREKALGKDHPKVASSLNNLAVLYAQLGRYAEAEMLLQRSLAIREKELGKDHPEVGTSLSNLAGSYDQQGRYAEAETLYKRGLAIREKALGKDHPSVAWSLNDLASLYEDQGHYVVAEAFYKRSLAIHEKSFGKDHPSVGSTLNNLAVLYQKWGRYVDAGTFYERSLGITEKSLGNDHPRVSTSLVNIAAFHFGQMDWTRATHYYRRGIGAIVRRTRRGTPVIGRRLTGQRKGEAIKSSRIFRQFVKSAYRSTRRRDKASVKIAGEMFLVAQWVAGSGAAASLSKMAARQATGNRQMALLVRERQDLVEEWQKRDVRRTASVSQAPSKRNALNEANNVAQLLAIENRIAKIDTRLAADFPEYAALANPDPLSIAEVQEHIKVDEALVFFLDTAEWKPTPEETFVWVVTKTTSRWVRSALGPKSLKDHVDALRCGLDYDGAWKGMRCFDLLKKVYTEDDQKAGEPLPFELDRAHNLYVALFGQMEDLIKGKDLLIVPSGPLTQLPFQVLVTEKPEQDNLAPGTFTKASWLAKKNVVTVLPSVSSLASLRKHAKQSQATKPFIGFGNPLLDGPDKRYAKLAERAREREHCRQSVWHQLASLIGLRSTIDRIATNEGGVDPDVVQRQTPLPETADELCAVASDAGATADDVYLGAKATEAEIKKLSMNGSLMKYKVLHFATHGALAGELTGSNEPGLLMTPPSGNATLGDDGYLSASEVAGLKLDADWVILSACNTASGETKNAEALSGLANAFFYAGARSLLVSHWYVDSQATVALITKAFSELRRDPKIGRAGALQQSMLALMKSDKRTWHPSYWAPFVVVGEGGPEQLTPILVSPPTLVREGGTRTRR